MTTANSLAVELLKKEEGFRATPYYCSEGYPTIGYGLKIGNKNDPLPKTSTTQEEAEKVLRDLVKALEVRLNSIVGYNSCTFARQAVLISIAYQIGFTGLLKFKNMLSAIEKQEYMVAADCMLDSLAARQTPERWMRNAKVMRTGVM